MKKRQMLLAVLFMLALVVAFFPADTQAKKKAKVKLNKTSATIAPGGTVQLKLQNNKKKVKWSSSKTSVATVNGSGVVTGKAAGSATVTAKVGKKSYKCKVTVKNVLVTIPQRGTKTDKEVRYVYKAKDSKPDDVFDFIPVKADSKEKADKRFPKEEYDYVGEAVVEMTDSWVGYQNFDTVVDNYVGAHRYNVVAAGKCSIPEEVAKLIKTSDDVGYVLDIGIGFTGYKSYAPYKEDYGFGDEYELINPYKQKGLVLNTTYDKTAGTFMLEAIDVRWSQKADYAKLSLDWDWTYAVR